MSLTNEFAHNLTLLKRCKKIYNVLFIAYIALFIFYPILTFFMGLGTVLAYDVIFLIIDSLIFFPFILYHGIQACYKKRDVCAVVVIFLLTLNQIILGISQKYVNGAYLVFFKFMSVKYCFWIHLVVLVLGASAAVVNLVTNRTYHKLETSEGFPHFNERFFEQEMDRNQYSIKNPYQQKLEGMKRTSSDAMDDISALPKKSSKLRDGYSEEK